MVMAKEKIASKDSSVTIKHSAFHTGRDLSSNVTQEKFLLARGI